MNERSRKAELPGSYASPPCLASEVAPDYFDPLGVDPQQALDVARWRRAERERLRTARLALGVAERHTAAEALASHLLAFLRDRLGGTKGRVLSTYWPIKGEPNLRRLMAELHEAGTIIALPCVETRHAPLVFRLWTPETRMIHGHWHIPVPPPEAPEVTPEITLAPVIGWDGAGYRLGYGGGYYDRTLAALRPRPRTIGLGLQAARLATIFPQPHDIPLDAIITEAGVQFDRGAEAV